MRLNVRLAIFLLIVSILFGCQSTQVKEQNKRLEIAKAMFEDRCKKAGVFIYKTVKDVDGILLMKIRPGRINYSDQFRMDDPYGRDLTGEGYIKSFLSGFIENTASVSKSKTGILDKYRGYKFVVAIDPTDNKYYRYTGSMRDVVKTSSVIGGGDGRTRFSISEFTLDKIPVTSQLARYGLNYTDISTQKDREYWIAGSSLSVIDFETNEIIAERIGYMMDYGQGSHAGGRSPWLMSASNACPEFAPRRGFTAQLMQSSAFIQRVLIPRKEVNHETFDN